MTTTMKEALGYTPDGNNPELLAPHDARALAEGNYLRVSGETICPHCQSPYYNHPDVQGALWLKRICPNTLAKL